jgi:peptidoglycan hydrolase CwlO-like protein/3D (Asp-Asp-Asp) domain-containing protein
MIKKRKQHIITAFLMTAVLAAGVPVYAYSTQEQIDMAQQENAETQIALSTTEERLAALEAQKGDSEAYLAELGQQIEELTAAMTALQDQMSQKEAQITQTEAELAAAEEDETQQYESMKLRIQYLYEESAGAGLLEALCSTDGFMDFLNRADAYAMLTQYDREMLQTYSDTVSDIKDKEAKLNEEKAAMEELRNSYLGQQEQIQALYEAAYDELTAIEMSIQDSESEKAALVQQIAEQEDRINQLLIQKYEEEAAAKAAQEAAQRAAEEAAAQQAAQNQQTSAPSSGSSEIYVDSGSGSSGSSQSSGNLTYLGNFKLTAYCSCAKCCGKWAANAGITASGAQCVEGVTVAMGGVPFGTQLSINGHIYTVQDRGTSYGHVDIYFSSHSAALQFGLQYADVYMVN